ncbi:MAG: head GIN domain-containing protein [Chitinophagaceae bacterium]
MKNKVIAVLVLFSCIVTSCTKERLVGEGPVVTETRSLSGFTGVSSGCSGRVNFRVDPVYKVEVTAQQNILDVLRTRVVNGVLDIDFKNNVNIRRHEDIVINVSAPSAGYFRLSGSGSIYTEGSMATNRLTLEVSGSGSMFLQQAVIAGKLDARISGSGSMTIAAGSAGNEELHISGSGNMDFSNLAAAQAETHISGSGDMKVNLSQSLDARISGSGSVYYKGNPLITTHISGSGKVKPI